MEEKSSITEKWRPFMGWTYMATCLFDFIVGPILYNVLQFLNPGQHLDMWQAVTLQGGGLYHLSMGAILGISAYGRTQEKINGVATPPAAPMSPAPMPPMAPMPVAPMAAPIPAAPMPVAPMAAPMPAAPIPVAPVAQPAGVVNTAFGPGPAPQVDEPL